MEIIPFAFAALTFIIGIVIGKDFPSKKAIKLHFNEELIKIEFLKEEVNKKCRIIQEKNTYIKLLENELTKKSNKDII